MKTENKKYISIIRKAVSGLLIVTLTVSMPVTQKRKETEVKAEIISRQTEWNIRCLKAEKSYEESKNLKKIKVAVLDSGLDYDKDLPVAAQKDFLGEKELHPLYQDMTGHGTGVASLICARENEDRITGIAANVELYIGRIFGYGNDAPVERVVRAVNWAVEEKVDIIHMSFGTEEYSGELEDAIEKAYRSGILIIAAAGNYGQAPEDESTIEYPAAFDNVIAVGATDKYNNMTEFSSTGTELDVVAPGDQILTDGAFGGVAVNQGTSISAAQVTGIAAVLWGKYPDKSNEFIKSLLVGSANKEAVNSEECGEGLVDYREADKNYEEMNQAYEEYKKEGVSEEKAVEKAEEEIPENKNSVEQHGEVNYVNASWSRNAHLTVVEEGNEKNPGTTGQTAENGYITSENITYVKMGAVHSDTYKGWSGMSANPYFHGRNNYFVNTHYLYCMADKYIDTNKTATFPTRDELKVNGKKIKVQYTKAVAGKLKGTNELTNYFKSFQDDTLHGMKDFPADIRKKIETDRTVQGYVLLGTAIHNLTDIFSHNVYKKTAKRYGGIWCSTVHAKKNKALEWIARADKDTPNVDKREKKYLNYLIKNFAISDKRAEKDNPVNLEKMYQVASEAGICILAARDSSKTWYELLKTKLNKAKPGGLRIKQINEQWKALTGKEGKFKKFSVGKNNKTKKIQVSYTIKNNGEKSCKIGVQVKHAYGRSVYSGGKLIEDLNTINLKKIKNSKMELRSYRGITTKTRKLKVQFKIRYSCKGMKGVRKMKGKKNTVQIAKIGKNVTFVPRNNIFEMTKGKKKKKFKGWHLKKSNKDNMSFVKYKAKKKMDIEEYPENMGDEITLYPVFK